MVVMMNAYNEWKSIVAKICRRALDGSMTIEEFYEQWPNGQEDSEFARLVNETLKMGSSTFRQNKYRVSRTMSFGGRQIFIEDLL